MFDFLVRLVVRALNARDARNQRENYSHPLDHQYPNGEGEDYATRARLYYGDDQY